MEITKFQVFVNEIRYEFPEFEVVPKETSKLMMFINAILLMKFWNPRFMSNYTTVMFNTVYMPSRLINSDPGYAVLRHELIHMRDAKMFPVFYELSYIVLLPTVFSMRAFWEYRGYCESLRVLDENQGFVTDKQLETIVQNFVGPSYLFMCPFRNFIKRRFMKFIEENRMEVVVIADSTF